jgi:hypothetical protein
VIDRKTALLCAALIGLMLVMAVWRISTLEHWTNRVPEWRNHHFAIASASHLSCGWRVFCPCHVLEGRKSRRREDRTLAQMGSVPLNRLLWCAAIDAGSACHQKPQA